MREDNKTELIGKVRLDYNKYSGVDLYSDGDIEDIMLELAMKIKDGSYSKAIEEYASWPIMYHFSHIRANIVEWIPISSDSKVLEIGSGLGAITGSLSNRAKEIKCVDISKKRSRINAYRNYNKDNIEIVVGSYMDIEPDLDADYDYIFIIGVLEYAACYFDSKNPFEDMLTSLKSHLASGGRIVIAIENKFGLKYWAGCREDHLGTFFSGLEGYDDVNKVRTFSAQELKKMIDKMYINDYSFYYPYPDYKFPTAIYSDRRLPNKGELNINNRNFDRDRVSLFDEKKVYDAIIEENVFQFFANSFQIIIGPRLQVTYSKMSNDRNAEYAIATHIMEDGEGATKRKWAIKRALHNVSNQYVKNMVKSRINLSKSYSNSSLKLAELDIVESPNNVWNCALVEVSMPYYSGITLEEMLTEYLVRFDYEGFKELFCEYIKRIKKIDINSLYNYDLIFSNIIVPQTGELNYKNVVWDVIDYEWTSEDVVDYRWQAFRALYCYSLLTKVDKKLMVELIYEIIKINDNEMRYVINNENAFHKKVQGDNMSLSQLRELIGMPIYELKNSIKDRNDILAEDRIQVYWSNGYIISENNSIMIDYKVRRDNNNSENDSNIRMLRFYVEPGIRTIRIDPSFGPNITSIVEFSIGGKTIVSNKKNWLNDDDRLLKLATNGMRENNSFIFLEDDPQIVLYIDDILNCDDNLDNVNNKNDLDVLQGYFYDNDYDIRYSKDTYIINTDTGNGETGDKCQSRLNPSNDLTESNNNAECKKFVESDNDNREGDDSVNRLNNYIEIILCFSVRGIDNEYASIARSKKSWRISRWFREKQNIRIRKTVMKRIH